MPVMDTQYGPNAVEARVVEWLLDSDPSIRWQVMRDLLDRPEAEWRVERAKVETDGWGARLLALEDDDGQWAGGAHFPSDFEWPGPESFQGPGKPWPCHTPGAYALWGTSACPCCGHFSDT